MGEWVIAVDEDLQESLRRYFRMGPMTAGGLIRLEEQVVDFVDGGLKVEIRAREHPPPHFHVSFQGESNSYNICTGEPSNDKALKKWFRNISKWHAKNRDRLVATWNRTRPSDCPVGQVDCLKA